MLERLKSVPTAFSLGIATSPCANSMPDGFTNGQILVKPQEPERMLARIRTETRDQGLASLGIPMPSNAAPLHVWIFDRYGVLGFCIVQQIVQEGTHAVAEWRVLPAYRGRRVRGHVFIRRRIRKVRNVPRASRNEFSILHGFGRIGQALHLGERAVGKVGGQLDD